MLPIAHCLLLPIEEERSVSVPVISIFSDHPAIQRQVGDLIRNIVRDYSDTLQTDCCDTFAGFLANANKPPRRLFLLTQEDPRSVDLAAEVRERFPDHCLIWFSNLDFALFAYRLDVDYFNVLPLTEDKLQTTLRNCMCHVCHHTPVQTELVGKSMVKNRLSTTFGRIEKLI